MAGEYRFLFELRNIHVGIDPFEQTVGDGIAFSKKLKLHKNLDFDDAEM